MKLDDYGYVTKHNILAFQKGPLSQWWGAFLNQEGGGLTDEFGRIYNCMEQYMMHEKAILFGDFDNAEKILKESNPAAQKNMGRAVKNFDQEKWDSNCRRIIVHGNHMKFLQNKELRRFLMATDPLILVEAAPWDKVWGCGTGPEDDRTFDCRQWQGQNLLGKCLMIVRARLVRDFPEMNIFPKGYFDGVKIENLKEAVGK